MATPLNLKPASEKIVMTEAVSQQKVENKWPVSFLVPSKYTMKTIPEPVGPAVDIKEIPTRAIAAVRYSGAPSRNQHEKYKAILEKFDE